MVYLSETDCLKGLVDCLKKSAGYAHALGHHQQNPNWLKFRDGFESMMEQVIVLATSKAMPRQQVLDELKSRERIQADKLN